MQRALQQARAEAAAQAKGTSQPAPAGSAASTDASQAQGYASQSGRQQTTGKDKKALGALLRRAAQKMQQETPDATAAEPNDKWAHGSEPNQELGALPGIDHSADCGQDQLDLAGASSAGLGGELTAASSTELLANDGQPHTKPSRGPSLGDKLGSILRNALSLPKQGKYDPISGEDDDAVEDVDGHVGAALPEGITGRALPRDASYLPEWLKRTFTKAPSSSARASSEHSQGSDDSRADLPEWVDVASLQQEGLSGDAFNTSGLQTALEQAQPQQEHNIEQLIRTLKPVPRPAPAPGPPAPLMPAPSWPPTEDQYSAAALTESRGKRLLAFWQQQQPTVAASSKAAQSSAMLQPTPIAGFLDQKPVVNQTPSHAVHARSRIPLEAGLQTASDYRAGQSLTATGTMLHASFHSGSTLQLALQHGFVHKMYKSATAHEFRWHQGIGVGRVLSLIKVVQGPFAI